MEVVMRKHSHAIVLTLFMFGAVSLLSACNTTAGAGEDISATGHAITNSADRNK